jgi:hypothetical protein
MMTQGKHRVRVNALRWARWLVFFCAPFALAAPVAPDAGSAARACGGDVPELQAIAPGLWLVPARPGPTDAGNRGWVVNLLLAQEGERLWLIGAGPSSRAARSLDCRVQRQFGRPISDVVVPRARAELAVGLSGLGHARHWAHADVIAAMRRQCPGCVERLGAQLGASRRDLGPRPIRIPNRPLVGEAGKLGPFEWRRVGLGAGSVSTLWTHGPSRTLAAWGVLWFGTVPDGRDADVLELSRVVDALGRDSAVALWVGEEGRSDDLAALTAQQRYWSALLAAVDAGLQAGATPGRSGPAVIPAWTASLRHDLNWQRAWRQAEDRLLSGSQGAATPSSGPSARQR